MKKKAFSSPGFFPFLTCVSSRSSISSNNKRRAAPWAVRMRVRVRSRGKGADGVVARASGLGWAGAGLRYVFKYLCE